MTTFRFSLPFVLALSGCTHPDRSACANLVALKDKQNLGTGDQMNYCVQKSAIRLAKGVGSSAREIADVAVSNCAGAIDQFAQEAARDKDYGLSQAEWGERSRATLTNSAARWVVEARAGQCWEVDVAAIASRQRGSEQ